MIMKKLSYTTILAAACLLLPGCSDDAADKSLVSPDVLVADSEVEIKLSSNSSNLVTRAGVVGEGDSFSTSGSNDMGIFCLAEEALPEALNAPEIDWTRLPSEANDVAMYNVSAKVKSGNVVFHDGAHYYYPQSNWYRYRFYGYYTAKAGKKDDAGNLIVETSKNNITVPLTFNGYDDILWGKSGDADDDFKEYAYSAKYYRKHIDNEKENSDYYTDPNIIIPKMTFHHVMTCLQFSVKAEDEAAESMTIKSIELMDAPEDLKLIVADKEDESNEGKVIVDENSELVNVPLMDVVNPNLTNATEIPQTLITSTETVIGGSDGYPAAFYVLPQKEHKIRVSMIKDGRELPPYEAIVNLPDFQKDQTTYVGYQYTVKLKIYGPQEISLKATLEDWKEVEDNDIPIEL